MDGLFEAEPGTKKRIEFGSFVLVVDGFEVSVEQVVEDEPQPSQDLQDLVRELPKTS